MPLMLMVNVKPCSYKEYTEPKYLLRNAVSGKMGEGAQAGGLGNEDG